MYTSLLRLVIQCRQGVKLAGQKVQAGVEGEVGGTMEDKTSSQSLVVELGNTVITTQLLFLSRQPCYGALRHLHDISVIASLYLLVTPGNCFALHAAD